MKMFTLFLSLFAVNVAGAATPFAASGETIAAIFDSPQIWKKVTGSVESIINQGRSGNVATYAVTTTEQIPVVDASGVTIGLRLAACTITAGVTSIEDDLGGPSVIEVTKVDFTLCPETSVK